MELNCNSCIKKDVCGIKDRAKEALEALTLDKIYQDLVKHNIELNAKCPHFVQEQKILRGEK